MCSDEKFWLSIWVAILVSVVIVIGISINYNYNKNSMIIKAVNSGADPVAILCALEDNYGNQSKCIVYAMKE